MTDKANLLLSANRALLDRLTENMQAITVGIDGDKLLIRVYYYKEPSENELDSIKEIGTEIIADYSEVLEEEIMSEVNSNNLECLDVWVISKFNYR